MERLFTGRAGERLRTSALTRRPSFVMAALASRPLAWAKELQNDRRGQIALIFAVSMLSTLLAMGGGIDLSRAYLARGQFYAAASLGCQYASRPSVVALASGANGTAAYTAAVKTFINLSLANNSTPWAQTNATPFTYTPNGPGDITLNTSVPTSFMGMIGVQTVAVTATQHCFDLIGSVQQPIADPTANAVNESFENSACAGTCSNQYLPSGMTGTPSATPSGTPAANVGYTGKTGTQWYITGYCLEVDAVGLVTSTVPDGTHAAALDCAGPSGTGGNSSISTKVYLQPGSFELRYNYVSRVAYNNYAPTYICGTSALDTSWANDAAATSTATRSNQINVYLDPNTTGSAPVHTTLDGTQTLAGSNLIDECVYAQNWIQRSVKVTVATAGYYWLSFAADGTSDRSGGEIDNILLCPGTCAGSVQDNFPTAWTPASNAGNNVVLFRDTFESPVYTANTLVGTNTAGNMNNSTGTSGASSGWPSQAASGWATAPTNVVTYWVPLLFLSQSVQGNQSVQLDTGSNHLISRPFLLVPGYYQLNYYYVSNAIMVLQTALNCGATPNAANVTSLTSVALATYRSLLALAIVNRDTNILGVFMSHAQLASTPNGGGALNSTTKYTNPDGTITTAPAVAPNGISLTSYNAAQPNPLLDICGYATSWQSRSVTFEIQKPAYYWLTFSSLGTADSYGGSIDDVRLSALGSLYMAAPPTNAVLIPVPNPQPGTTLNYTGFSIPQDVLTP